MVVGPDSNKDQGDTDKVKVKVKDKTKNNGNGRGNGAAAQVPAAPPQPQGVGPGESQPPASDSPTADQPTELRLDQFLKWQGLVGTGGEAKFRIQGGEVRVNGAVEQRRGRKLQPGDRIQLAGLDLVVPPFQARR